MTIASCLCFSTLVASDTPPQPEPLWRSSETTAEFQSHPVWVPRTAAFDESGDFSIAILGEQAWSMLDYFRRDAAHRGKDCISFFASTPRTYRNLEQAVASVPWVVAGQIAGTEEGFLFGQPGTLFRIVTTEHLKRAPEDNPDEFLMFYPIADFEGGNYSFCMAPEDLGSFRPEVGSRVILIASETLRTSAGDTIVIPSPRHDVFWVLPGNELLTPQLLHGLSSDVDSDHLRARIHECLHETAREAQP